MATYSVNCVLVTLKTGDTIVENAAYTLTVNGIPTPDNAAATPGSIVVTSGKAASGGTGYSSSSLFTFA